jgi:hypothetical protein
MKNANVAQRAWGHDDPTAQMWGWHLDRMYEHMKATPDEITAVNNHMAETVGTAASVEDHRALLVKLRLMLRANPWLLVVPSECWPQ